MNLHCEIVEDLLPLYADKLCSARSQQAVAQHLQECEACRAAFASAQAIPIPHIEPHQPTEDRAVKKSFRKIRLRWWASILLVIIAVPLLFLGWNEYHKEGLHYTNLYEYGIGKKFMSLLADGNYEEAYSYIDVEDLKHKWLEEWFDEAKLANMEADGLAVFCEYGAKLEAAGGIGHWEYMGISLIRADPNEYRLFFKAEICGTVQVFHVDVRNDGITSFGGGGSFIDDPLAQFSIWAEYLWQNYAGCYFDPDSKDYVYYDNAS